MTIPASAQLPNYPCFANARTYDAEWLRMTNLCWASGEGIAPMDQTKDCTIASMGLNRATDLEVVTGASGLNVSVTAGNAWVAGDGRSTQGLYFCYVDVAKTVTMTAAHATLPRVDAVILKVDDADVSGSATQWSITKQDGTATVGATLTNLTGAPGQAGGPTFQTTALLLAYVLTPATFAGPYVNATHILDQRFFAYRPGRVLGRISVTSNVGPTALAANGRLATLATLDAVGNGVNRVEVEGIASYLQSTAASLIALEVWDNAAVGTGVPVQNGVPGTNADGWVYSNTAVANGIAALTVPYRRAAYSGKRTFRLACFSGTATTVVAAAGTSIPILLTARYI